MKKKKKAFIINNYRDTLVTVAPGSFAHRVLDTTVSVACTLPAVFFFIFHRAVISIVVSAVHHCALRPLWSSLVSAVVVAAATITTISISITTTYINTITTTTTTIYYRTLQLLLLSTNFAAMYLLINTLFNQVQFNHIYVEGSILLVLLWILFKKTTSSSNIKRTESSENLNVEQKIKMWTPKPMVNTTSLSALPIENYVIDGKTGHYITINGQSCINFATHNYFNFINDNSIENNVIDAVNKYGIGSCGPRAFYGTFDIHIELEEKLAKFMEMEEAVIYSYGFSTVTSAIQAYVKSTDIVYVDEEVNFAIQKGLQSSKAELVYFKHNCPEDLERLVLKKNATKRRRNRKAFLIVEGIYMNTGNICNLPNFIDIRIRHKIRIFIDETISFGVLGEKGRGITEHFNIPKDEVDLIIGSLETSLSSVGGFCVGSTFVVEHQRLSGLGYCFSASLPPLLSAAAIKALDQIEKHPEMLVKLRERSTSLHRSICNSQLTKHFTLGSDATSPLKHLYLIDKSISYTKQQKILKKIVDYCISEGVAITTAAYLSDREYKVPTPSIRLLTSIKTTDREIDSLINTLLQAVNVSILQKV